MATIRGYPVYVVTEVALTPCASYTEARDAVAKTALHLEQRSEKPAGEIDSDDETELPSTGSDDIGDESSGAEEPAASRGNSGSSVAEDVISKRGSYGRFAQRWFSRGGWMQDQKRSLGLSSKSAVAQSTGDESQTPPEGISSPPSTDNDAEDGTDSATARLLPKLLRTTLVLFGTSRSFFFSYDYDITRRLAQQYRVLWSEKPLHQTVDPVYFWNRHAVKPFIDSGVDFLVLPLMQGFVGQGSFVVDGHPPQVDDGVKDSVELSDFSRKQDSPSPASPPAERTSTEALRPSEKKFEVTLISRRSTKRAGLRYLRRGVDEEGNVANAVETEQLLFPVDAEWSAKIYSFVQTRGSIPLFFTQSPYSLKPAPVIQHSLEANFVALKKHFGRLRERYSSLQVVSLVERHGIEAPIGLQYQRSVQRLNEEGNPEEAVPFEWFDFHDACRGMKFENVSLLLDTLGPKIAEFGSTVEIAGEVVNEQKGVFRTNCMDCLDRTNVCQSSFAKHMLDLQLKEEGFDMSAQVDQENAWFNTMWADNGDAISKQYASTAAMKGDYTRTKKRDYRGALTDAGLSLTRFFNG